MEQVGLIKRRVLPKTIVRIEYILTDIG
ncbi:MAG: hypothetical protein ABIG84_05670 [archaeon]